MSTPRSLHRAFGLLGSLEIAFHEFVFKDGSIEACLEIFSGFVSASSTCIDMEAVGFSKVSQYAQ